MCQDYVYDKDIEQIAKEEQRKAWKLQGRPRWQPVTELINLLTYLTCLCARVFRHRRKVLNVGAHQEGAGAAPPQPQEEENHLQLHHRSVSATTLVSSSVLSWSSSGTEEAEEDDYIPN